MVHPTYIVDYSIKSRRCASTCLLSAIVYCKAVLMPCNIQHAQCSVTSAPVTLPTYLAGSRGCKVSEGGPFAICTPGVLRL